MKRLLCIIICAAIIAAAFGVNINAAQGATVFYLDYGDVKIGDGETVGYDINGNQITELNGNACTVTQLDSSVSLDRSISVTSGSQKIELLNVNIKRSGNLDYAVCVLKTASAEITLSGENHLVSGTYRAGLDIATGASAVIDGDGVLYAQSEMEAGIGGGNGKSNGTLVINSGVIYAMGGIGGYSAGIGGGTAGSGGNITINGGFVVAQGGLCAAGIGGGNTSGGGNITINGGTVTAIGGAKGAGIGGGFAGGGGNVTINGGSVKAVAGQGASDIGNGYNCKAEFSGIKNSDGETVSLATLEPDGFNKAYFNGVDTLPVTMLHPDDGKLYFYTASNSVVTLYNSQGSVKYFCGIELAEVNPFSAGAERFFDSLIVTESDSLTVGSGFSLCDGELLYGSVTADRFTVRERGDVNSDSSLDGQDAVLAACVAQGMLTDELLVKLSDANGDRAVDENDRALLESYGLMLN
ncbi:MAG: hypothetical protein ACI4XH_10180 [Acutalibacteraceae bacterium]